MALDPGDSKTPGDVPASRSRGWAKQILLRGGLILFGLALGAAIGEIALRLVQPNWLASSRREKDLFCRFDPEVGWVPLESVTAMHGRDGKLVAVHQNQFGARGPDEMRTERGSSKRRILVLGDSYMWGFGVAQQELFSDVQVCGTNVEILNFGVSGYGTDQEYLWYLRMGSRFKVDEVVLAFTPFNDIENNLQPKQYGYLKPYFTLENGELTLHTNHLRDDWSRAIVNSLRLHSRLWNAIGDAMAAVRGANTAKAGEGVAAPRAGELKEADVSARDRAGVELTVAILKKLRDAVAAQGAKFSVVFVPFQPHVDKPAAGNHPLVPLLVAGLQREGIAYLEPYPEFVEFARSGGLPFNRPDTHFSKDGHALFAKSLVKAEAASVTGTNGAARQ